MKLTIFPDTLLPFTSQPGIKDPSPHLVYKIPISMSHSPKYRFVFFLRKKMCNCLGRTLPLIIRANIR